MHWIDLSDQLKPKAYKDFKVGQVLTFDYESSKTHLKIMRIDEPRKRFWVKEIEYMTAEEIGTAMARNELKRRDEERASRNG